MQLKDFFRALTSEMKMIWWQSLQDIQKKVMKERKSKKVSTSILKWIAWHQPMAIHWRMVWSCARRLLKYLRLFYKIVLIFLRVEFFKFLTWLDTKFWKEYRDYGNAEIETLSGLFNVPLQAAEFVLKSRNFWSWPPNNLWQHISCEDIEKSNTQIFWN